ncbi:MAG: protein kinase domain-containing protein [Caldimonas sp.]
MTSPADTNEWAAAMAAFDAWADLPEAQRLAWLENLAATRPGLHARVLALIRADLDAEDRSFLSPQSAETVLPVESIEGKRLGPWLIERLIGSGGMGQVWLARRTDGLYDGRAAIKLMRLAVADAGANERFAREGRLLGRLNHPNIARLLDAGVTPSGERFLVLEYVEGERIDRWCDEHRLTVAERVALFVAVCKAVAHAHENLVVHRDLKPSNIFVTRDGEVKLLDFGVAKLLDDEAGESTELTREAGAALTPQYAAPEQLSGGMVSTATDVYGLGMVLYGLLSGSRPYATDSRAPASRPGAEAPSRPLWSLPPDNDAAERVAMQRATSVKALRKTLRGDLAVVVAKAIKTDPGERYRAVPDFADDLQRVLDRRPITARPDSVGYRTRRYLQRHAFGVGATALVVLAVLAGLGGTLAKQREAEREAARAVAVKRFLLDMFQQARTSVQSGGVQVREATVNDMVAAGAERIGKSFASEPEIRDEIFGVIEELYSDAFDPKQALALARQRLDAARDAFGPTDPRVAPAQVALASSLVIAGEIPEAQKVLDRTQALLDRAGDDTSLARASLLRWQGIVVMLADAKPEWHAHPLRRAIELLRARYPDDDELLESLVSLPSEACRYGEPAEAVAAAEELYRRAVKRYGADNLFIDTANLLRGQLLLKTRHPGEALPILEEARDNLRRHVGPVNQNVLLADLELAVAYRLLGRADDSESRFAAVEAAMRRDHPGDQAVARMVNTTRDELTKLKAGQTLHRCGP